MDFQKFDTRAGQVSGPYGCGAQNASGIRGPYGRCSRLPGARPAFDWGVGVDGASHQEPGVGVLQGLPEGVRVRSAGDKRLHAVHQRGDGVLILGVLHVDEGIPLPRQLRELRGCKRLKAGDGRGGEPEPVRGVRLVRAEDGGVVPLAALAPEVDMPRADAGVILDPVKIVIGPLAVVKGKVRRGPAALGHGPVCNGTEAGIGALHGIFPDVRRHGEIPEGAAFHPQHPADHRRGVVVVAQGERHAVGLPDPSGAHLPQSGGALEAL